MASNLWKIQLSWNDVIPTKRRVRASKKDAKPKLAKLDRKTRKKLSEPFTVEKAMELRRKLV